MQSRGVMAKPPLTADSAEKHLALQVAAPAMATYHPIHSENDYSALRILTERLSPVWT
jgi:hypothetical protein